MPNGTYGGVRGEETKVGQKKTFVSRPTRLLSIACGYYMSMLIEVSLDGAFGCFLKFFLEDFESAQLAV